MIRYVAFLIDINAGSKKHVTMEALRTHFEMPGIERIATYMQSGNVLFDADETDENVLRTKIEKQLELKLGHKVIVIIRMQHDIKKSIKNNPFQDIKTEDRSKLYVTFLSGTPAFDVRGSLGVYSNDAEYARVVKKEVYVYTANYGKTCFSNAFIEKKLGLTAATRNWSTVNKIIDL